MPNYYFRNKETGEEWSEFMKISDRDEYLEKNTHIETWPGGGAPALIGGVNSSKKVSGEFRNLMEKIKKDAPGSKMNIH